MRATADRECGYAAVWQLIESHKFAPSWLACDYARVWEAVHAFADGCNLDGLWAALRRTRERADNAEAALHRVRELHRPVDEKFADGSIRVVCNECGDGEYHPCPTIRTLAYHIDADSDKTQDAP